MQILYFSTNVVQVLAVVENNNEEITLE